MKIALGLFHFNPYWNNSSRSGHRHCSESLAPLLRTLAANPKWQLSLEIAGTGLEFIHDNYPDLLALLRVLVDRGQIELISSLYTPNIWVAFPLRDLLKSIELNKRCLANLGFPWTRMFFCQEAFFGPGVTALKDYFDVAICKDDYVHHFCDLAFTNPCVMFGDIKIVIASSHLLNELTILLGSFDGDTIQTYHLQYRHLQALEKAKALNDSHNFPAARGEHGTTKWLWYHCGDGNHFGTIVKPDDLHNCYFDPIWNSFCISLLIHYQEDGYHLGTIRQFIDSLDYSNSHELPLIPEGSWNSGRSEGVRCWMGRHNTPWEQDCTVLTAISQSRARLITAERAMFLDKSLERAEPPTKSRDPAAKTEPKQSERLQGKLDEAWSFVLHAQISDALGWHAGPRAVLSSIEASESALAIASQLLDERAIPFASEVESLLQNDLSLCSSVSIKEWPSSTLFGADGGSSSTQLTPHIQILDHEFEAKEACYGVSFPFEMDKLVYCPCARETEPVTIYCNLLKVTTIHLPLVNGLLQISPTTFLIKDMNTVHIAASIQVPIKQVSFAVQGTQTKGINRWRFYLVSCDIKSAVVLANRINHACV